MDTDEILLMDSGAIVSDTFTRADSAATLGNAETGQSWQAVTGTWGISSNKAYIAVSSGLNFAVVDSLASDVSVSADITWLSNESVVFRFADVNNYLLAILSLNELIVYKVVAGTATQLGLYNFVISSGTTYNLKVTAKGQNITVYLDGTQQLAVTDAFNQAVTKHGLRGVAVNTARFDNFKVEDA